MTRVALYARVSTHRDQSVDTQLLALRLWAQGRGHTIAGEFVDEGISGKKGRDRRPGLDAMLTAATLGEIDMVAATALDRLGRSLPHLIAMVAELEALKVGLFIHNMALDTSTPMGQLMFNVMGSFAEFEREMIRERTLLGLERARAKGKKLGRPKIPPAVEHRITAMLEGGIPITRITRTTRVGYSTVYRIKTELEEAKRARQEATDSEA
jgi:DNA invertase Pin-like site-specific DNA recombinase